MWERSQKPGVGSQERNVSCDLVCHCEADARAEAISGAAGEGEELRKPFDAVTRRHGDTGKGDRHSGNRLKIIAIIRNPG